MTEWILFPSEPQKPLPSPAEDVIRLRRRCNVWAIGVDAIVVTSDDSEEEASFRKSLLPFVESIHKALRAEEVVR